MSAPALALVPGPLPLERSCEEMLLEAVLPESRWTSTTHSRAIRCCTARRARSGDALAEE